MHVPHPRHPPRVPKWTSERFQNLQQSVLTRDITVLVSLTTRAQNCIALRTSGEQELAADLQWKFAGKSRNPRAEQLHPSK